MKPELVLSNTTSFFIGGITALFKNAKKYGFKYVEIIPYRWTTPKKILALQKKYDVRVAGIHLPTWWKKSAGQLFREQRTLFAKFASVILHFYLGEASQSPGWQIARELRAQNPYLVFHTQLVADMGPEFSPSLNDLHPVIENIPYQENSQEFFWNPQATQEEMTRRGVTSELVFDPGHFGQTREDLPDLDMLEIYERSSPEIIHISYNSSFLHSLPNKKEQGELTEMLKIHLPRYITIETNPWVSIKKAKLLLEEIIRKVLG